MINPTKTLFYFVLGNNFHPRIRGKKFEFKVEGSTGGKSYLLTRIHSHAEGNYIAAERQQ